MSERITTSVASQPQSDNTTPEAALAPVATPTPEAVLQEQAAQAAELAAKAEEAALQEADSVLKAAVRAYRRGEKAYAAGLLESGRLVGQYLVQRMALKATRANAVKAVEGELARWSSSTVDANRLVKCYHAFHLLAETQPDVKAENVPYGTYRDAYAQLVVGQDVGTPQEHWTLLPGLETECLAVFAKCTQNRLSRDDVATEVKAIVRLYAERLAEAAKAQAEAKAAAEVEAKAALQAAKVDADKLAEEKAKADAAVQTATAETKATLTQAAEEAKAALLAKQRELVEAAAKAEADGKASALAASLAKKAEEAKAKAAAKELARAQKVAAAAAEKAPESTGNPTPATTSEPRAPSVKATAKVSVAKDYAEMVVGFVMEHPEPDDVLEAILHGLKATGDMGKVATRAIDAALAIFTASTAKPTPKTDNRTVVILPPTEATALARAAMNGEPVAA